MSVVEFVELGTHILALDSAGCFLAWDIAVASELSTKDAPFFASHFHYKVISSQPISLTIISKYLCVCGSNEIVFIEISRMQEALKKYRLTRIKQDLASRRIQCQKNDEIKCLIGLANKVDRQDQMMNEGEEEESIDCTILYGTKRGKIYSVTNSPTATPKLVCQIETQSQEITARKQEEVRSMALFRQDSLALVATSLGRILILNLNLNSIVEDITAGSSLALEPIRSLRFGLTEHKFYTIHHSYVVEWSLELQKALGYYSYPEAHNILVTDLILDKKPHLLICGGSRCVQVQGDTSHSQIETSLKAVHVMKSLGGKLCLGGSNGMVEIFKGVKPSMLLFQTINE